MGEGAAEADLETPDLDRLVTRPGHGVFAVRSPGCGPDDALVRFVVPCLHLKPLSCPTDTPAKRARMRAHVLSRAPRHRVSRPRGTGSVGPGAQGQGQ